MATNYDQIAADYRKSKFAPWRVHIEQHTLFTLAGDLHGKSVLDLACGDGIYSRTAKRLGADRVVGVDLSAKMIELARSEETVNALEIEYHIGDATTLDLGERFDIVLASYLLNYAPNAESLAKMAGTIAKHLKPGGRLIAVNNNPAQSPLTFERTRKYGLIKSATQPLRDGDPVTFTIIQDGGDFKIENYHLSTETHERIFKAAGLERVRWHRPDVAPEARKSFASDHWYDFLSDPPVIFIEAYRKHR